MWSLCQETLIYKVACIKTISQLMWLLCSDFDQFVKSSKSAFRILVRIIFVKIVLDFS